MYRVIEVSHMLNVSKVTIYKKMSALKEEIRPFVVKEKNVTYLTEEAVALIREQLKQHGEQPQGENLSSDYLELKEKFEVLKGEVEEANSNLEFEKQGHLNNLLLMYDYLQTVKKNKEDRLKSLRNAVENIRLTLNDIDKQIELFDELNQQSS